MSSSSTETVIGYSSGWPGCHRRGCLIVNVLVRRRVPFAGTSLPLTTIRWPSTASTRSTSRALPVMLRRYARTSTLAGPPTFGRCGSTCTSSMSIVSIRRT